MDPLSLISKCYSLYEAIQVKLDTVVSNRHLFNLLKIRVGHIREPLLLLQKLQKEGHLPCSDNVLLDFYKLLAEVAEFVAQKRFQEQTDSVSTALRWLSDAYNSSEDQAQFIEFDKQISNHLQSLNLHVTVQLLDYSRAAHQDTAKASAEVHSMELHMIDMKKLVWDPSKTKNVIGMGSFSSVIVGQYNKEHVAIKQVKNVEKMTPNDLKTIQKEAMIMQYANHRNILAIKGANLSKGIIVMELAVCSLSDYLYHADPTAQERARPLLAAAVVPTLQWRVDVIRDVSDAVRYLHAHNILHRDIKSPNVLLFRDPATGLTTAKLGDFGLALAVELASRTAGTALTTGPTAVQRAVGTYSYMAPELFDREPGKRVPYSEASDVYSLGVLVNEVLSGHTPWEASAREADIQNWVFHKRLRPKLCDLDDASSSGAGDAGDLYGGRAQRLRNLLGHSDGLHCCWSHQPHQRCTAADVYMAATAMPTAVSADNIQAESTPPQVATADTHPPISAISGTRVSQDELALTPARIKPGAGTTAATTQRSSAKEAGILNLFSKNIAVAVADPEQDPEVAEKREEIALHMMQTFPDVPSNNARRYATSLFNASVYTVPRLLQLVREKGKSDAEFTKWAAGLGISTFDAMDMKEFKGTPKPQDSSPSLAALETQHGADRLVEWLVQQVPDLPLQSKRRRVAELLCEAGVTCAARLVRRVRDVEWLVKLGVDRLDAEDIVAAIILSPSVTSPLLLQAVGGTQEGVISDFAADLRCVLSDMSMQRSLEYCTGLFEHRIYTVNRLQRVVKKEGTAFLTKLKWHDFDVQDASYLSSMPAGKVTRTPLPEVDKLHGVEVLSLWLLDHVPNITLSSIRTSYCKALLQHNVSTVQRLARHGCSEAWLVSIGVSQLDAKDIVDALLPIHNKDPVVVSAKSLAETAAAVKRTEAAAKQAHAAAGERARVAALQAAAAAKESKAAEQRQKNEQKFAIAREKLPAKAWKNAESHECICFKPWCELLLEPDQIYSMFVPCRLGIACVGFPCMCPFYCGLCCARWVGCEINQEYKPQDVGYVSALLVCLPITIVLTWFNMCSEFWGWGLYI